MPQPPSAAALPDVSVGSGAMGRGGSKGGTEAFASLRETLAGGAASIDSQASALPGTQHPTTAARPPLGFNCPACGVVLVIQVRDAYHGEPAPCPKCGAQVLPPRVVSPGKIDLHPLPGLTERGGFGTKMPRALHRSDRHPQRLTAAVQDFEGLLASFE